MLKLHLLLRGMDPEIKMELVPMNKESFPETVFIVLNVMLWLNLKFSNKAENDLK